MRIVGGKYKGRVLTEFKGQDIRPTSSMVRESLFNILQFKIFSARFLDLFSGTGAMGIEALSRGAKKVHFNDINRQSLTVLKQNLDKLKVEEEFRITNLDALTFLNSNKEKFDIIYIDPPYKTDLGRRALDLVVGAIDDGGTIIFEDEKPFNDEVIGLEKFDSRKYGRVHLTFFRKGEN